MTANRNRRRASAARKTSASSPARAIMSTTSTARPDLRHLRALAARPRQDQGDRHRGRQGDAGRGRGVHRHGHRRRQGRRPDLRLDGQGQGRPAASRRRRIRRSPIDTVRYVGDTWRWSLRRPRRGQGRGRGDQGRLRHELPAVVDLAGARKGSPAGPRGSAGQHDLRLGNRREGRWMRPSPRPRTSPSSTLVNNRLIPNAMEPRAAVGGVRHGHGQLHAVVDVAEPARAAAGAVGLRAGLPEHKLRVIAPDVGGGFGSKIFCYNEETGRLWASRKSAGRSNGPPSANRS